jgi:hypothetical protein
MCILIAILFIALLLYFVNQDIDRLSLVEKYGDTNATIAVGWEMVLEVWALALLFVLVGVLLVILFFRVRIILSGKKILKNDLADE